MEVHGASADKIIHALSEARRLIANMDAGWDTVPGLQREDTNAPKFVSGVVPIPDGGVILVDGGSVPIPVLLRIPDLVAHQLETAGVSDASVTTPPAGGRLVDPREGLSAVAPVVTLRMFPKPPMGPGFMPNPVFRAWVAAAWSWLQKYTDHRRLSILELIEFPLPAAAAEAYLMDGWRRRSLGLRLVAGDTTQSVAALLGWFYAGNLQLAYGGRAVGPDELTAVAEEFKAIARSMVDQLSLAFISAPRILGYDSQAWPYAPLASEPGATPAPTIAAICDELLFDVYPYQILGPGHISRLGVLPEGATELGHGYAELTIGQLSDWTVDAGGIHSQLVSVGRELLMPCLPPESEASAIFTASAARH